MNHETIGLLLPLLLAVGCGDKESDDTSGEGGGDDTAAAAGGEDTALPDAPYLGDPVDEQAQFDADEVALAVQEALSLSRSIEALSVINVYNAFLSAADASCPQWTEYDGLPTWLDSCTSEAGVTFDGYGILVENEAADLDGSGVLWTGYQLYSASTMTYESNTLTLGGDAAILVGGTPDGSLTAFYSYIGEGFGWDGEETGTWMDMGISPEVYFLAYTAGDTQVVQLAGLLELDSGPVSAVVMDGLYLVNEPTGTVCGAEPSGTISVLDGEGRWYDLIFDGPTEGNTETDMAACDGCATAWYRGEAIGEACVDFSELTDWTDNPWDL